MEMSSTKKYLSWTIRIVVCFLFLLSGVTKMFPLWAFEKQLVDLGICNWCWAHYLARCIIGFEIAIGIAILQKHFLKRIVIPATIVLLVAFCIHLSFQMYQYGPMNGNCGCFGQLIPMTPLEAFIKNILTIGLLIWLYKLLSEPESSRKKYLHLLLILGASVLLMFMAFPFCPCEKKNKQIPAPMTIDTDSSGSSLIDSVPLIQPKEDNKKPDTAGKKVVVEKAPKKTVSRFSAVTDFSGKKVNLDDGKKIVCLFAPGCDHCRATAKEICALAKSMNMPPVYIIFMDEETFLLPDFWKAAQCTWPHHVVNIPEFWTLLGSGGNTPGVFYLWNGNIIKSWEGITGNAFNAAAFKKAVQGK